MNDTIVVHEIHPLVKEELLDIYGAIASVCAKHGLRHWAAFGSLLGAVRHHGFIPWDDDLDIMMLREDYEEFQRVCAQDLPECYELVSLHNCSVYPGTFFKIQETRKAVYDRIRNEAGYVNPHGLYIDVFPLDGVPNNVISRAVDFVRCALAFCRTSYLWRGWTGGGVAKRMFKTCGCVLGVVFRNVRTPRDFALLYESWMKKYEARLCREVRIFRVEGRFQSGFRFQLTHEILDDTVLTAFENIRIPIPANYDFALRQLYGPNYLTPPPLEKRVSEHSKVERCPWYYGPDGKAR